AGALYQKALRHRAVGAVRVVDQRAVADHGVRVLVRAREDRVERLRDRVRDDEAAADHRHAEHDRERRQDGADRAGREALERDAHHRPVTSCMAASTSTAVDSETSLTIRPSAMNRMRSAMPAARGPCAPTTAVWPS